MASRYGIRSGSRSNVHTVPEELHGVVLFLAAIWIVYAVSLILPIDRLGLYPRSLSGLLGIVTMPFLHANVFHLLGNTIPLAVLLTLLAGSRANSTEVVASIVVIGGALLWVFGRSAIHVGASGLISGLATFLITAGLRERRIIPLVVAVIVFCFYGMTLVRGLIPWPGSNVSWDGHLTGAIAGILVAWPLTSDDAPASSSTLADRLRDQIGVG